jgi:hypothetical protein
MSQALAQTRMPSKKLEADSFWRKPKLISRSEMATLLTQLSSP